MICKGCNRETKELRGIYYECPKCRAEKALIWKAKQGEK